MGILLLLLFTMAPPPAPAAEQITWSRDLYNPNPRPDDVLLPLPCGGAMAFRWVRAEGAVPAGLAPGLAPLFRLVGPFAREGRHDLLVGKYEVSRLQYETLPALTGGACPRVGEAGRLVQGGLGWYDALGFAARWSRWLAQHAGSLPDCARAATLCIPRVAGRLALVRLPTEAEWEYVARGGLAVTPVQFGQPLYPMADGLEHHVWYERNSDQQLKPIGQRAASPLGLHDLYGNVEELTLDLYRSALYPGQTGAAVIRGGSVHTGPGGIDAGQRRETPIYGHGGANRAPDNGVRLIADVPVAPDGALTKAAPLPAPSAAAATVADATGQIQVNADTPAQVRIDGALVGQAAPGAPVEVRGLRVGEHLVELSAAGHQAVSERHGVTAGRWTQVAVEMQPFTGFGTATGALTGTWHSVAAVVLRELRLVVVSLLLAIGVSAFVLITALRRRFRRPVVLAPANPFEPVMIALPGGAFWMGSPIDEPERGEHEGPRHRLRIRPFAIGKTAVTFTQYDIFAEMTGRAKPSDCGWGRGQRPVINVSWEDAMAYADWLSKRTGAIYRLPSEAEWEYAARAGTETPFWTGRCIATYQANYDGNYDYNGCGIKTRVYRSKTIPVGSLPANPWGLQEVHGNVWEWVQDQWHDNYAGAPTNGGAWEAGGSSARVLRGGSWNCRPGYSRAAYRSRAEPGFRFNDLGFRLVRTLPDRRERAPVPVATAARELQPVSGPTAENGCVLPPVSLRLGSPPERPLVSASATRTPILLVPRQVFKPPMIALPGGEFWMGSPEDEPGRSADEGPRHQVRIAPFGIGKTAVTFAHYDAFCEATGRAKPSDQGWGRDQHPVINVSWDDAIAYAVWLSQETGDPYRLPSEAEWEYAARAGTATPYWTGGCIITDQANYDGNHDYNGCGAKTGVWRGKTVPVESLPANPWGLHEVHGNVWEWVQDTYQDTYAGAPVDGSAWQVGDGLARVFRGGSWSDHPHCLRSADRSLGFRRDLYFIVGFRLAMTLPS